VTVLAGKAVVVTGAGRGLGAAYAELAAANGAAVVVNDVDAERAGAVVAGIEAAGGRAIADGSDIATWDGAGGLVARCVESFGTIDGLVNNAGIFPQTDFLEISDEEWDLVLRTDLGSAFASSQAAIPGMLQRGRGSIVMISSRLGQIGFAGVAHYSAAKAGLIALAKSLSREFGPRGVRANTVAPGVTVTAMGATVMEGEVGRRRMAELPLGRFATAEEVAAPVMFLLSDASAAFLGQTLNPNCGGFMP
jgi:3-oxoacyl-[acyl-carrier protein] reductase